MNEPKELCGRNSKVSHFQTAIRFAMFRVDLAVILVAVAISLYSLTAETTYTVEDFYSDDESCRGVPNVIRATEDANCTMVTCFKDASNNIVQIECFSDYEEGFRRSVGNDYIVQAVYKDSDCSEFSYAIRYRVSDDCMAGYFESETLRHFFYYTTSLEDDGSARLEFFSSCPPRYHYLLDGDTAGDFGTKRIPARKDCVADFSTNMFPGYHKWYTSEDEDDSGLSDGIIACIFCGSFFLCFTIGVLVVVCQEKKQNAALADASVDVIVTSLNATVDNNQIFHYEQEDQGSGAEHFAAIVEDLH
ncbi:hypothetical protein F444_05810 [Phytophthora nicotianae P1976]|uniref:TKL protein kinase n=1 Tax=Phytophthora nicotianae P1976 TaxID=1317066 RepID=A0A081AKU2_PHYNI|nr:hypothetical protein F444_05810 [Phytophthora nicotianae P1976]